MNLLIGTIKIKGRELVILLYVSIIMSAYTIISYVRVPRIWLCGIIGVFFFLSKKRTFLLKSSIGKMYLIWLLFMSINTYYSYYLENSMRAFIIFISFFLFMAFEFEIKDLILFSKLIRIIATIFAFTILLNVLIPGLFYGPFHIFVAQSAEVLQSEISNGIYSGIAGERAQAAFFMNIAIIFYIGKMIGDGKTYNVRSILPLLFYMLALMLTGKRTLLMVSICIISFSLLCMGLNKKSTFINYVILALIVIPILLLGITLIPQAQIVFNRFSDYSGDNTYNGRIYFWEFCLYMFSKNPIIGFGFDTFNEAFGNLTTFSYHGEKWTMYAHSLYYELLGETGIIGTFLFLGMILCSFIKELKLFKKIDLKNSLHDCKIYKMFLFISMGIQIMFCMYGATGNVMYDHCQFGFLIFSFIITMTIERKMNKLNLKGEY